MAQVQAWGYPRPIPADEAEHTWMRYGPHAYAWYAPVGPIQWVVHLCVAPPSRRRLGLVARHGLAGLFHVGAFLGARQLVFMAETDSEIAGYALRAGWSWDDALAAFVLDLFDEEEANGQPTQSENARRSPGPAAAGEPGGRRSGTPRAGASPTPAGASGDDRDQSAGSALSSDDRAQAADGAVNSR